MDTPKTEIRRTETISNPNDAPSPSLNTTYYPPKYFTLSFEDESSPGHPYGVPRRRPGTPAPRSNPRTPTLLRVLANPSQTEEYRRVMCDIRNMRVLRTSHRIAIQHFSREQLLEIIDIYDLIMQNVNYLFS
jgi:hypothetical protein